MKNSKWWEERHPDLEDELYGDMLLIGLLDDETNKAANRKGIAANDEVVAARKEKRHGTA